MCFFKNLVASFFVFFFQPFAGQVLISPASDVICQEPQVRPVDCKRRASGFRVAPEGFEP